MDRLARWRQVAAHLERAEQAGRDLVARRPTTGPGGPPLELTPDERVLAELPVLTLVEVRRAPGRRRAGYAGYSPRGAAELQPRRPVLVAGSQRVRGQGAVTVTDRRIVFHGPTDCTEWPLDRLIRLEHARRRPVSLLPVTGRRGVFGLLYRAPDAAPVRAVLELAAAGAAATDGRAAGWGAVLANLAADRHRHGLDRPRPPWPVSPDQAPGPIALARRALRARRARYPLRWRLAQATLAALAMIAAVVVALPQRPAPPIANELATAATSSPAAPPAAPAPPAPAPGAGTGRASRTAQACWAPEQNRGPRACRLPASAPAGRHPGTAARGHRDQFRAAYLRAAALEAAPLWALDSPGLHAWVTGLRATHQWAGRSRGRCHALHHGHGSRPPDSYRTSFRVAN